MRCAPMSQPDFDVHGIARFNGMSVRTLNCLFAAEGTAANAGIWSDRLAASHKLPSEGRVMRVGQAAFDCGTSSFRVIAASDSKGVLDERFPLKTDGKPSGFYSVSDGTTVSFALLPVTKPIEAWGGTALFAKSRHHGNSWDHDLNRRLPCISVRRLMRGIRTPRPRDPAPHLACCCWTFDLTLSSASLGLAGLFLFRKYFSASVTRQSPRAAGQGRLLLIGHQLSVCNERRSFAG